MMLIIDNSYLRLTPRRIHRWRVIVVRSLNHFFVVNIMVISLLVMAQCNYQCSYKAKNYTKNNYSNNRANWRPSSSNNDCTSTIVVRGLIHIDISGVIWRWIWVWVPWVAEWSTSWIYSGCICKFIVLCEMGYIQDEYHEKSIFYS